MNRLQQALRFEIPVATVFFTASDARASQGRCCATRADLEALVAALEALAAEGANACWGKFA